MRRYQREFISYMTPEEERKLEELKKIWKQNSQPKSEQPAKELSPLPEKPVQQKLI